MFAVSLRDLARFVKVMNYFKIQGSSDFDSAILAIFFSYYCRFDTQQLREEFIKNLKDKSERFNKFE